MHPAPNRIAAIHGLGETPQLGAGTIVVWGAILALGGLLFWGALQNPKPLRMRGR
jgi:hypothetical protein